MPRCTRKATSLEIVKKKDVPNIEVDEIKKSKIEKTRDFLTLNKVFFETVAATTLTAMAIVLAWGQLRVAEKQTEYLERQTVMQNAQASPQFVVDLEHIRDNATNAVSGDRINIHNQGLLAREVKVDALVLVKMVTVKNTGLPEKIVPLTGYFWITAYTGNTTGLMATIDGTNITTQGYE